MCNDDQRFRNMAERARTQLEDGTRPQVVMVCVYPNPRAPRTSDEEYAELKAAFLAAQCPSAAFLVGAVQFMEAGKRVTVSVNLKRVPRVETWEALVSCCDMLLGTRMGVEGAAVWLKKYHEALPRLPDEVVQLMEKYFAEAAELLTKAGRRVSVAELFGEATREEKGSNAPAYMH